MPTSTRVRWSTAAAAAGAAIVLGVAGCGTPTGNAANRPAAGSTSSAQPSGSTSPSASSTATSSATASGTGSASTTSSPTSSSSSSPTPSYPSGPPMLLDSILPADQTTVGVAMPIVVNFSTPVKASARKGIEQALHLSSSRSVVGAWHWLGSQQVDFRPRGYWPADTKVTLDAAFDHVPDGNGRYGTHSYTHHFTVGSDLETKISASHHTTKVYKNNKLIKTMPSDAGSPEFPSWTGTMGVVSKTQDEHMTSCSAGITCDKGNPNYYYGHYPWAVRLTNSGTFIHFSDGDPYPGHSYGSHGCVHLSWSNAKWYFNQVKTGDPVTITGSPRGKADPTNGIPVYNVSWPDWLKNSALGAIHIS